MTAIVHCGHCAARLKGNHSVCGFPASTTGWGNLIERDNAKLHSAGFLRGMTMGADQRQQKSVTQPVVSWASTNEGCGWTLDCADE